MEPGGDRGRHSGRQIFVVQIEGVRQPAAHQVQGAGSRGLVEVGRVEGQELEQWQRGYDGPKPEAGRVHQRPASVGQQHISHR